MHAPLFTYALRYISPNIHRHRLFISSLRLSCFTRFLERFFDYHLLHCERASIYCDITPRGRCADGARYRRHDDAIGRHFIYLNISRSFTVCTLMMLDAPLPPHWADTTTIVPMPTSRRRDDRDFRMGRYARVLGMRHAAWRRDNVSAFQLPPLRCLRFGEADRDIDARAYSLRAPIYSTRRFAHFSRL